MTIPLSAYQLPGIGNRCVYIQVLNSYRHNVRLSKNLLIVSTLIFLRFVSNNVLTHETVEYFGQWKLRVIEIFKGINFAIL